MYFVFLIFYWQTLFLCDDVVYMLCMCVFLCMFQIMHLTVYAIVVCVCWSTADGLSDTSGGAGSGSGGSIWITVK